MKKIRYIGVLFCLFTLFLVPAHAENMDGGEYVPPENSGTQFDDMYPDCKVNDYECIADHIEGIGSSTPQDFKSAIQSFDPKISAQEVNENYSANFQNSTMTAMTENLSLIKPHTFVMMIANFIVMIFETIGGAISLITLVAYNFLSGSSIETLISGTLENMSGIIFNWKDTSSWIYNILFLIAFIGLVRKSVDLVTKRGGMPTNKNILAIVFETIASIAIVVFIGIYGRPIINYVETTAENSIVSTFSFGSEEKPLEIAMKEQIFDIMQMKPFMMRHFGTSNINALPLDEDVSYDDLTTYNTGRVQKLLTDPSTTSARAEKELGNGIIMQGIGTSFSCIGYSFLGLIHKLLAGFAILMLTLFLGAIRLLKEVLLFFSILGLIVMLLNTNHPKVRNWFFNRLMWVIVSILISIFFSAFLFAWGQIMDSISGTGFIFTIVFDALLIFLLCLLWHFKEVWIEKFKDIIDTGGDIISGAFNGTITPSDAFSMVQSTFSIDPDNASGSSAPNQKQPVSNTNTSPAINDDLADDDVIEDTQDNNTNLSDDYMFPNEIPTYKNDNDDIEGTQDHNTTSSDDYMFPNEIPTYKNDLWNNEDAPSPTENTELEEQEVPTSPNTQNTSSLTETEEKESKDEENKEMSEDILNMTSDELKEPIDIDEITEIDEMEYPDVNDDHLSESSTEDMENNSEILITDNALNDTFEVQEPSKNNVDSKTDSIDQVQKDMTASSIEEDSTLKEIAVEQNKVSEISEPTEQFIQQPDTTIHEEEKTESLVEENLDDELDDLSDDAYLEDYEETTYYW